MKNACVCFTIFVLFITDDYVLSDDAKFELIYREDDCFAQSIRFLLTYMNKKFNDVRYDKTQWTTNKIGKILIIYCNIVKQYKYLLLKCIKYNIVFIVLYAYILM